MPGTFRRERTQVPTVADPHRSQEQGQEAISDLFQDQEEDTTVAAKDGIQRQMQYTSKL